MPRIIVNTGNGKGKTTAALGTVLRALGQGMRALVFQFMKNDTAVGEYKILNSLDGVDICQCGRGFVPKRNSPKWEEHRQAAVAGLEKLRSLLTDSHYDLIVLDEICGAIGEGLIEEQAVVDIVGCLAPEVCIILTGRDASPGLIEIADTVTEMLPVKHGMDVGLPAQNGVEF